MLITIRFPLHTVVMVILFATTYPRISLTEGRNPVGLCFSCCCDPICKQSRNCYSRNEDWNTSDFRCIEFPNKVDGSHAGGYIMLAECPSNWNGTVDKAAKCALKKVNIASLAGLRSIDLATNFTYPNSYCAQCNNTLHDYVYYTEIPEVHAVEEKPEEKMDVCYHKCIIIPKTEPKSCPQIQQPCNPNEPSETFWSHICIASSKREVPTSEQPSVQIETTVVATSTKAKQCNGSAFPPEEFVLWPNNSVFVSSQNKIYDNNSYILVNKTLIVCSNSSPTSFPRSLWSGGYPGNGLDSSRGELNDYKLHQDRALDIVNYVGFSMSITALLFLLLTYFLFAELRTYPGKTVMHLSCALIAMQLTYLVSNEVVSLVRRAVLGVLFHYFILAVFLWTSVIAHDTQKTFTALRVSPKNILVFQERKKAYIGYCVFSWGIPFIVVGICVTLHLTNTGNVGYGAESACRLSRSARLYAISIPVSLLLLFNLIALIRTVVAIKLQGNMREPHKKKLPTIVLKLVVIMGMTWIPGIAAAFLPNPNLEYPFFVLNSLQGVLICFSFLCKRQIITLYKQKFARSKSEIPFVVSANTTNTSKVSGYSRESCM